MDPVTYQILNIQILEVVMSSIKSTVWGCGYFQQCSHLRGTRTYRRNKGQGHCFSSLPNPVGMSSLPVYAVRKIQCQEFSRADLQAAGPRGRLCPLLCLASSSKMQGILFTMLVFGPACGFILGSFCTKIYVDAVFIDTSNLDITPDDPRWIGAWWGGFLLCGALLFFSSVLMFGFPQSLPPHSDPALESEQAMLPEREYERPKPSNGVLRHPLEPDSSASCFQQLRVIPKVTKHLLSNPVFTCIILAACMEIAVVAGFAAFLGKYLEQQFNLTTSSANQLLGMTAIPCACLGIFLGGLLVKKLSLSALGAIRMAMLVNLVSTACYVSFLFLGCDTGPVAGVTVPYGNSSTPGSALDPYSSCNKNCECQTDSFTPVCGADGITYLSACFAGCNSTNLTGCACLMAIPPENATVIPGKCPSPGCQEAFLTFLCVMCVCSMIGAMAQTPSVIILIRTVSPELKSYALGVLFLLLRLLGFIPPPLIFGAGIDSTCLFWSTFCGEQGACALYDNVAYRYLYVSIAIALKSFAFLLYTTTWQCLRKNYKRYIKNHEGGLSTNPPATKILIKTPSTVHGSKEA
uniref:Solute carrier organic anion transporter family member n=1 Tax=Capra hircus TaxID=9925 RepID=A0A8C2PIQ7_CAPHI